MLQWPTDDRADGDGEGEGPVVAAPSFLELVEPSFLTDDIRFRSFVQDDAIERVSPETEFFLQKRRRIEPGRFSQQSVIQPMPKTVSGRDEGAYRQFQLLEKVRSPQVTISEVLYLFSQRRKEGVFPSLACYNQLLLMLLSLDSPSATPLSPLDVLDSMRIDGIRPRVSTVELAINALLRNKNFEAAVALVLDLGSSKDLALPARLVERVVDSVVSASHLGARRVSVPIQQLFSLCERLNIHVSTEQNVFAVRSLLAVRGGASVALERLTRFDVPDADRTSMLNDCFLAISSSDPPNSWWKSFDAQKEKLAPETLRHLLSVCASTPENDLGQKGLVLFDSLVSCKSRCLELVDSLHLAICASNVERGSADVVSLWVQSQELRKSQKEIDVNRELLAEWANQWLAVSRKHSCPSLMVLLAHDFTSRQGTDSLLVETLTSVLRSDQRPTQNAMSGITFDDDVSFFRAMLSHSPVLSPSDIAMVVTRFEQRWKSCNRISTESTKVLTQGEADCYVMVMDSVAFQQLASASASCEAMEKQMQRYDGTKAGARLIVGFDALLATENNTHRDACHRLIASWWKRFPRWFSIAPFGACVETGQAATSSPEETHDATMAFVLSLKEVGMHRKVVLLTGSDENLAAAQRISLKPAIRFSDFLAKLTK